MPDPLIDVQDEYASSEDSDFAPDAVPAPESEASDSEDNNSPPAKRRRKLAEATAEDAGYDNSGDEAIIKKGEKKKRKKKTDTADDDEGGEGGLIKTRRQRAAEKEERKINKASGPVTVDIDALWAQMLAGPAPKPPQVDGVASQEPTFTAQPVDDTSDLVRIKRTYNFAGKVHTEEKLVPRTSAEAKLYLSTQPDLSTETNLPTKRVAKKAFRSRFEPKSDLLPQRTDLNLGMAARLAAGKEAAKKLNTVEKSRMDWAGYVDKEGIKDELELAGKSKGSHMLREDFLARSEMRREDDARRARLAGRV